MTSQVRNLRCRSIIGVTYFVRPLIGLRWSAIRVILAGNVGRIAIKDMLDFLS